MPPKPSCIHWFRKGLRLSDNPALLASIQPHQGQIKTELIYEGIDFPN